MWLDAMILLARRPNFNLAHVAVCSVIDSALLRYESLSERAAAGVRKCRDAIGGVFRRLAPLIHK